MMGGAFNNMGFAENQQVADEAEVNLDDFLTFSSPPAETE